MKENIKERSKWWFRFFIFLVCTLFFYAYSIYRLHLEKLPLSTRASFLEAEREKLIAEIETLEEMKKSFLDPSADEYALISRHGRIPEGAKKLIFPPKKY